MPEMLFEIWRDGDGRGTFMFRVHPQSDKVLRATNPNAVLVHSFTAPSDFEAFRRNNAWQGFEPWTPPDDFGEHFFTEEEVAEQRTYLRDRKVD